jgi:transposase
MGMHQTVSHCGMDCHRTFSRLTARDVDNHVVFRERLEHEDRKRMEGRLERLPKGTPIIIEGTFGWGWMADEIQQCGHEAHLANCRKVDKWREAQGMVKTNKIDADLLSELWTEDKRWWEVWLAPREVRDQRELLRYRMGLVQIQTMTKNRIHATLHRHGIINKFSDLFGRNGRRWLELLLQADEPLRPISRQTLKGHLTLLDQVRRQIALATRELRRQVRNNPQAELWRTLPGINWILAYTIQAEIGDIARFSNDRKLARYALLAPLADDSGEETDDTPLNRHVGHMGRRTLKWAFIEAGHGAVNKSPRFQAIFNRRTDNGKRDKNRGYIAVGRQLCHVGFACVTKGVAYTEQRPPRPGEKPSPLPAAEKNSSPELGQPDRSMARSSKSARRKTRRH